MPVPSSLALTNIADGATIVAADHRNNYAAIQAAVNALIGFFGSGSTGSTLRFNGTDWVRTLNVLLDDTLGKVTLTGATGGVKFGNGATALNYYEEGTFTPAITFGGASVGVTYTRQNGTYKRIGSLVFFTIDILLSSKGSSVGTAALTGLPFTSQNANFGISAASLFTFASMSVNPVTPILSVDRNATTISLQDGTTLLTNTSFSNTSVLQLGSVYFV